ncbi:unnamed protein product [Nippostrongylus brasiliensis]|uniref:Neur_chan_LBD domain-containing protein n=1 Tax=Nippostrongylus brasiliensis TaxID=27835 RepID=A0A0N4XNI7_NIPBR|nr:unnamed protein product [Nippostrongylus brasiliensis]
MVFKAETAPRTTTISLHKNTGGPVLVTVNIYLRSISKIDDVNMEYSAQFTFREEWVDARLAYGRFEDESTEMMERIFDRTLVKFS